MDNYNRCYTLRCDMTALKAARLSKGLSQVQAAARLGVSQPYLAMLESGRRRLTAGVALRAVAVLGLSPVVLPSPRSGSRGHPGNADELAKDLASLGYPGFAYLRMRKRRLRNPAEVLLAALGESDLEARLVEALPWLLLRYWNLDHDWLVREAKLGDLQNRLGFVVTLARRLAEGASDAERLLALRNLEARLERSRLAREDTLCRTSMPPPEHRWLTERRSDDAKRWNLVTYWTVDDLRYAA